jgi:hypothetical protein
MFSGVRRRFSYANVVATLALVFAMSGGALAASKYLITSTKQIKPSVLSSLKGKAGPAGAVGGAGPAGAVGPAGAGGAVGPAGAQGPAGEKGAAGPEGKAGKNGTNGKEGSPWTANGTLPVGSTETGTWSMGEMPRGAAKGTLGLSKLKASISFTIPLAKPIEDEAKVHVFEGTTVPSGCSGTVVGGFVTELTAESGNLCVWVGGHTEELKAENIGVADSEAGIVGAGTRGAILELFTAVAEGSQANGTWAVRG